MAMTIQQSSIGFSAEYCEQNNIKLMPPEPTTFNTVWEYEKQIVETHYPDAPKVCPKCQDELRPYGGRCGAMYISGVGCFDCEGFDWRFPDGATYEIPASLDIHHPSNAVNSR